MAPRSSPGSFHDASVVLGVFSILGRSVRRRARVDLHRRGIDGHRLFGPRPIVVFDRIRENFFRRAGDPFEDVVNHHRQTLTRSLNTSLTVILTLLVLILFGGSSVRPFVLAMLVGISVGTYSSIFVSSMLLASCGRRLSDLTVGSAASAVHEHRSGVGVFLSASALLLSPN